MKIKLLLLYFFIAQSIFSQHSLSETDFPFIEYLISREEYDAALKLLNHIDEKDQTITFSDSLNYLKGWAYYSKKQLDQSTEFLNKVSSTSAYYSKSRLFSSYNKIHLKEYNNAYLNLSSFSAITPEDSIFKNFLYAGLSLLKREYNQYESHIKLLPLNYYGIKKEIEKIEEIKNALTNYKKKSATLAGLMSAIIPGSGKIYLGKTGQGISSMLLVTGLGFVTAENVIKKGPTAFSSLFFASTFSFFYIGNIYGTVKLTHIAEKEFNTYQDAKILFNLHIPLRNIYN